MPPEGTTAGQQDGGRCPGCGSVSTSISRTRALGDHDGALRAIVHALKYDGRRSIAPALSALMRQQGRPVLAGADVVVPVPLHWRRQWTRGFNQAALLAEGLGVPLLHALRRRRATRTQTALPAEDRQVNVARAFVVRKLARVGVKGVCVVLIDDVRTTGATLEACAQVLMEAGAREVRALTAARVATRPRGTPRP